MVQSAYPMRAVTVLAIAVVMLLPVCASYSYGESNESFYVTDDHGNTLYFDGPVDHIISIGTGLTASVIQLDAGDKIVVSDSYSQKNSQAVFDKLRQLISEGKATAGGNIYSSGVAQLKNEVIDASDSGRFDKTKDVIVVTGADTYLIASGLVQFFKDQGFRILAWRDVVDYDSIVDLLGDISRIATGSVSSKVTDMYKTREYIQSELDTHAITQKREQFYVTFSGGEFKVGNIGSLATSMLLAAGGDAITIDPGQQGSTYQRNLTEIIEEYGTDVVIFADNSISGNPTNQAKLRLEVGTDVKIVPLQPLWNNFSIESQTGVWIMACAMYPEYFHGNVPSFDTGSDGDVWMYALAGICGSLLVIAVFVYVMRKA